MFSTDIAARENKIALGFGRISRHPAPLPRMVIVQTKVSPTSLTFAVLKVGSTSAAKKVTLTNNLSTALTISSITFTGVDPGDFTSPTNTCGGSLAAKSTSTISVIFTPGATGGRTATMNVNDSANNSPQTVALTGTGKEGAPVRAATLSDCAWVVHDSLRETPGQGRRQFWAYGTIENGWSPQRSSFLPFALIAGWNRRVISVFSPQVSAAQVVPVLCRIRPAKSHSKELVVGWHSLGLISSNGVAFTYHSSVDGYVGLSETRRCLTAQCILTRTARPNHIHPEAREYSFDSKHGKTGAQT